MKLVGPGTKVEGEGTDSEGYLGLLLAVNVGTSPLLNEVMQEEVS